MNLTKITVLISVLILLLSGCTSSQKPASSPAAQHPYTQGNVTLNLKKGVTTEADVVQAFGAPNIVTQDSSGQQVWVYQKDNVTVKSGGTSDYFTILIIGASSGNSNYQQSAQTMTLVIHFDKNGKVSEFKSMSTSF